MLQTHIYFTAESDKRPPSQEQQTNHRKSNKPELQGPMTPTYPGDIHVGHSSVAPKKKRPMWCSKLPAKVILSCRRLPMTDEKSWH